MSANINVRPGENRVILEVDGKKYGLPKKAALDLAEKLKASALKAGPNDWGDIYRGFPNVFKYPGQE
ncbi:hypothetical protein [Corynebacterium glyciniphilum]|uniref:hypothetical protein n=1 Tax=Corynebacterium glyciniphilum TaxID=1404244 RepID=UPI002653A341|nr:hypothetical protein [Corynebacterium glyciniphilum]MDN6706395.1 hypothetical protein [Corynebacterium glyciniphilum]